MNERSISRCRPAIYGNGGPKRQSVMLPIGAWSDATSLPVAFTLSSYQYISSAHLKKKEIESSDREKTRGRNDVATRQNACQAWAYCCCCCCTATRLWSQRMPGGGEELSHDLCGPRSFQLSAKEERKKYKTLSPSAFHPIHQQELHSFEELSLIGQSACFLRALSAPNHNAIGVAPHQHLPPAVA